MQFDANKKFCLSKRPQPPKCEHFVSFAPGAQENFCFQAEIAVQKHYVFYAVKRTIFLGMPKYVWGNAPCPQLLRL